MKKITVILCALLTSVLPLLAAHIRGGEVFYQYLGPGSSPNSSQYLVTLKLYISCSSGPGQIDASEPFTIFRRSDNSMVGNASITAPFTKEQFINYDPNSNPCITNPPNDICYRLRYYEKIIELPNDPVGYTISFQRCCRIANIENIQGASSNFGATYLCHIPGTNVLPDAYKNSSPLMVTNDAVAICINAPFTFDFSATEPDGTDSLVYSLCDAYTGGGQTIPPPGSPPTCLTCPNPNPAAPPPYISIPYSSGYSGSTPLGFQASINSRTGVISGIAPGVAAQYVVTACVDEYRQGKLINTHRKDIHLRVADCVPLSASLKPDYSYCDDFAVTFKNEIFNPPGSVYIWQFGDGTKADTSLDVEGKVLHTYADTGSYAVKVKVILAGQCIDSTVTVAKVYPGYFPGFVYTGACLFTPFQFRDTTKSTYGVASKWRWTFGDETTSADTSHLQNPSWQYSTLGIKKAILIVESNKGCIDTVDHDVEVKDKPNITMPFRDTLICSIDTLQLQASGTGIFSWAPSSNMINSNSGSPLVFPKTTTRYQVTLNENGCVNTDTVRVNVVDFVTLSAGPDSTICLTDTIQLRPNSNGLKYVWTPVSTLDSATVKNPRANPTDTTQYHVVSHIGKCFAEDDIEIRTVPYPTAVAGNGSSICFGDTAIINASMIGSRFTWSPANTLSNPNSLNTLAFPAFTTKYTLQVYDNLGCPKPGTSSVTINVHPKIFPFAGNDTSIVVGQPLQLNGSGAPLFQWTPSTGLNRTNIHNPIAVLNDNTTYYMRTYTQNGCFALDTINVKVFKTQPDIFVPNAFVPGGVNKVLRPIPVGITNLSYFRIYNRWGQLVFQTTEIGKGWDGTLGGKLQASGTFVWVVSGKDYTGKTVTKKGTAILIR